MLASGGLGACSAVKAAEKHQWVGGVVLPGKLGVVDRAYLSKGRYVGSLQWLLLSRKCPALMER